MVARQAPLQLAVQRVLQERHDIDERLRNQSQMGHMNTVGYDSEEAILARGSVLLVSAAETAKISNLRVDLSEFSVDASDGRIMVLGPDDRRRLAPEGVALAEGTRRPAQAISPWLPAMWDTWYRYRPGADTP